MATERKQGTAQERKGKGEGKKKKRWPVEIPLKWWVPSAAHGTHTVLVSLIDDINFDHLEQTLKSAQSAMLNSLSKIIIDNIGL